MNYMFENILNRNTCSHIINIGTTDYSLVTTGYCDTDISSREECSKAAYHLALPDTSAHVASRSDRPYGCISSRSSGALQWNAPGTSTPSCGTTDNSNVKQDCICGPAGSIVYIFKFLNS